MKRRFRRWLPILLALLALAVTLRLDLRSLALVQGQARLQAGDIAGAEAAYARAVALGAAAAPLAYNLGVSAYRNGDYPRARERFLDALATAEPDLAAAVRYNLGNGRFRQGEQLAAGNRDLASRLLQEAIADYGKALALSPAAADAGHNLAVARARLAALGSGPAHDGRTPAVAATPSRPGATAPGSRPPTMSLPTGGFPAAGSTKATPASAEKPGSAEALSSVTRSGQELTPDEAVRLLSEARGREKPLGLPRGGSQRGQLAKPDKDW